MFLINEYDFIVEYNVFKIRPVIKWEKLPVHSPLVKSVVESQLNRWRYKYVIHILLKLFFKKLKYI